MNTNTQITGNNQLDTNQNDDRESDTKRWYQIYVGVLGNIGWIIKDVKFNSYQPSSDKVEMSTVAIDIIEGL